MPRDEITIVHSIKMIARQHQRRVALVVIEMMQALAHGVGGPLKPIGPLGGYLGCEDVDEAVCESAEAIRARDVTIERRGVVLSQYEDAMNIGVDAVGNRNVDQAILSAKRNRGLGTLSGQRMEPLSGAASQNNRQNFVSHTRSSDDPYRASRVEQYNCGASERVEQAVSLRGMCGVYTMSGRVTHRYESSQTPNSR